MRKPFLLIMGDNYYPSSGTGDWIKTFETYEEAESMVVKTKFMGDNRLVFKEDNREHPAKYDWFEIVDLREWTE